VLHAATNAHASAPLSRPTNLEIMCVPLILDDEDGIGGSLQRPFNSLHFADAGLLTGRTGNASLSEVESGFPTITEPPFDHDHCSHDYVLGRTTIHLVRIGPRRRPVTRNPRGEKRLPHWVAVSVGPSAITRGGTFVGGTCWKFPCCKSPKISARALGTLSVSGSMHAPLRITPPACSQQ
jgi:hypothetical protein